MGRFIGNLDVCLADDTAGGKWQLLAPLSFESTAFGITVVAPVGFQTDFCSVPRVPIIFDALGDKYMKSGTVHDYLYSSHEVDRETADKLLREMLMAEGATEAEADAFYTAVRLGGESHW